MIAAAQLDGDMDNKYILDEIQNKHNIGYRSWTEMLILFISSN